MRLNRGRLMVAATRLLALVALLLGLPLFAVAQADDLAAPTGAVVLTVAGKVGTTNRGPFRPFDDAFLDYHERTFVSAAEFDYEMLEKLGLHEVEIELGGWPAPQVLQGPWLRDVLAAAGAQTVTVTALALDGFAVEIMPEDLALHDWMVAIKRNGAYLRLGQRGPIWIVYGSKDGAPLTAEDEARWPWAVFYLEVD